MNESLASHTPDVDRSNYTEAVVLVASYFRVWCDYFVLASLEFEEVFVSFDQALEAVQTVTANPERQ
ncbi:hypothetical protein EZV61_18190 [Corallincola luteus]|uniref:Uncharacterized protein n=1 Tax=Corallincola luteus TaxID=1775177 RepID=A0ABY2AJ80_9GAMM|nr:hypothetical protein [Corallincola luteus]TCI01322.1 hypothetical protein EZV61_18190 [Corallincola luteus]